MKELSEDDLASLFPKELYTLGSTVLELKPLSMSQLPMLATEISKLKTDFSDLSFTSADLLEKAGFIANIIVTKAPSLLSVLSGLSASDIPKLPLTVAVDLAVKCVDLNIASSESFIKNLVALVNKINTLMSGKAIKTLSTLGGS